MLVNRSWMSMSTDKTVRVLFICTHNSARSQIAEALINALPSGKYTGFSAGTEPTTLNPLAVKVMAELGVDISGKKTKHISAFRGVDFDYVVTVCDHAKVACPFFPGAKNYLHKGFTDPADQPGSEEEQLAAFRKVRDEIRTWIEETFKKEA